MNNGRRKVLQGTSGMAVMGLMVAAGLVKPGKAFAQQGGWIGSYGLSRDDDDRGWLSSIYEQSH